MMDEKAILTIIHDDSWMMEILTLVKTLKLPDWWIGAGFVRSKVWDYLHKYKTRTPLPDIDIIYFDPTDFSKKEMKTYSTKAEDAYQKLLKIKRTDVHWSVTNQARMHKLHNHKPYKNSTEALSRWVETATCVGVKLNKNNKLELTAPRGIDDLVHLKLRLTPGREKERERFDERIKKKGWLTKWPKLEVIT